MLHVIFGIFLVLLLQWQVQGQGPPKVTGSYMAYGEIVEAMEDFHGLVTQSTFEESYDADTKNAAFVTWLMGNSVTFIENFETNQTYKYVDGKNCELVTIDEWIKTKSPPSLMGYEDTNGTIRFSLKQLFALDDRYLAEMNYSATYRGIPARQWKYEMLGSDSQGQRIVVNIYAYWSDGSWNTTSSKGITPLGFTVTKVIYGSVTPAVNVHEQYINVFSFLPGTFDRKLFEPVQGVFCPGRLQTKPFPNVNEWQAVAIHSEMLFPDYQEIRYIDTYYNPKSKLVRVDYERMKDQDPPVGRKYSKYQSETAIGLMRVVFRLTYDKGLSKCSVIPFEKYEFDLQNLINFKLPINQWKMGKMFGLNDTTYVYTGKTTKRGIPCHVFQGIRKDWPDAASSVSTLWEWCFNVNMTKKGDKVVFRNKEVGLINAQVKILESGKPSDYPPDFRMVHHFYDINVKDPVIMDAENFDISRCFEEKEKTALQFEVDWSITDENLILVENSTSDAEFLRQWKTFIYKQSGVEPYTLRVTKIGSTVMNRKLLVKFLLLAPHKDLPKDILVKQKSSLDAEKSLRNNINSGRVFINYKPNKESKILELSPVKNSLQFQLNRTFVTHTLPPTSATPSASPTGFIFSLRTEERHDGSKSTSDGPLVLTSPNPEKQKGKESTLYKAGTVATVSIALLLVGITIGSAGTLFKYNGLPSCIKNRLC